MKGITMNDSEIKDIDKLKNLLIEFGVEFCEHNDEIYDSVVLGDGYYSKDFIFTKDGNFECLSDFD